jgi:hypothetical protein
MIPNAMEVYKKHHSNPYEDIFKHGQGIEKAMIEFAKLHVEAALEAAAKDAKIEHNGFDWIVDDKSIEDSYPLDNIK